MTNDKLFIITKIFAGIICLLFLITIVFIVLTSQDVIPGRTANTILYSCLISILIIFAMFLSFMTYMHIKTSKLKQKTINIGDTPDIINTINDNFDISSI